MTPQRRELPYAWAEVKAQLQANINRLLTRLGFGQMKEDDGRVWPRNPWRDDRRAGSFNIAVARVKNFDIGAWHDFATKDGGDIFDLIARCERHADKMSTYWWALEWLGWGKGEVRTKAQADQDREREEANRRAREAKSEEEASAKRQQLLGKWLALPGIGGTVAETYLREARGIDLSRLPKLPEALHFSPAWDHFDKETGEITTWPAMVSAMTRGSKLAGLHITWLAPDGSGKAPVTPAKKMRGSVSGSAIRLTRGAGGLSPTEAQKRGAAIPLVIGEGIETTLTCGVAQPGYRAWAAGSLSLMGLLDWPPFASAAILLRDNDWKPEAVAAFDKVVDHWRAQAAGRPLKVVGAKVGNDFNDWVRA
ncbi:DUF7146 domain-containing protein [Caulobacter hibisci]|uniref:Toprim domain-containing protein n=1 Tax=Caulobacter hibisci TaxID=2035993 RepID=A0ABS0SXS6_9CAUL|nr:toprim domain-containing protein [Caulobacter hibisci]MBI1684445.1 toprim domain-containing protein [Caulobacter hibisci]